MSLLIRNATVLDPEEANGIREERWLHVEDGVIQGIGPEPRESNVPEADRILEADGDLVVPGLNSSHGHSPEIVMKGSTEHIPLEPWLLHLFESPGLLSAEDMELTTLLTAMEMIKTGTTGNMDHVWFSPHLSQEKIDAVMEAYKTIGIRACVVPLFEDTDMVLEEANRRGYEFNDIIYGNRLDDPEAPTLDEILAMLETSMDRWHGAEGGRLSFGAGPSGLQWCTEECLDRVSSLATDHDAPVHIHGKETELQSVICDLNFDRPILEILAERGVLNQRTSFAHGVWLTDSDLDILAETGSAVAHNPASNQKLGSGRAPVRSMLEKGVTVGLGVDGAASNDNQRMFESLKLAALMHNRPELSMDQWLSAREVLSMATEGGATILGHGGELGSLEEGNRADFSILNRNNVNFVPVNDVVKQLVYCETGSSVETVVIDGELVLEEGRLTKVDEEKLLERVERAFSDRASDWITMEEPLRSAVEQMSRFRAELLEEA